MRELKPCPFCGGEDIYADGYDHAAGLRWRVLCLDCMGMVDPGTIQQKYRAIEAWNRRASDNKDAEIERLKENIKALENDNYNAEMNLKHITAELAESQRREKAVVEDLYNAAPCFACVNFCGNSGDCDGAGRCRYAEPEMSRYPNKFVWRGPVDKKGVDPT